MKTNFLFSFHRIFFFPAFLSRLSGSLSAVFVLLWLAACSRPLCEGLTVYDDFPQKAEYATPLLLGTTVSMFFATVRFNWSQGISTAMN